MDNVTKQMIEGAKAAGRPAWYKVPRSAFPAFMAAMAHLRDNKAAVAEMSRCTASYDGGIIIYVGNSEWSKDIIAACEPIAAERG